MPIRKRKPTSPGRRFQSSSDFSEVTKDKPEKRLTKPKPKTGGRNSYGRMTSRHRGGGEGKSSGGRHPVSPWGKPEGRTRKKGKASDKLIIRRRRTRGARR